MHTIIESSVSQGERKQTIPDNIRFYCPGCRSILQVPHALAGVEGPCPHCSAIIRAPQRKVVAKTTEIRPINFKAVRRIHEAPEKEEEWINKARKRKQEFQRVKKTEDFLGKVEEVFSVGWVRALGVLLFLGSAIALAIKVM